MEKNKESDQQNLLLSLLVEDVRWLKQQKCSIQERINELEGKIASIQQHVQESPIAPPPPSSHADESITAKYKLVIRSVVSEIVHIGRPIGTTEGNGITVAVEDLHGNQIAAGHHLASLKVELVVVKAEFYENVWDWTKDEFEASVIKTDTAKEKIKSAIFQLKDGKGVHENTRIHKSSNKQYVKLGVKVIEHTGERVLEGVSNSFFVQHRPRGKKSKEESSPRPRRENSPTKERGEKRRATNNALLLMEEAVLRRQPSQHAGTSNAGTDTDTSMGTDVTDDDGMPHNFGGNFPHPDMFGGLHGGLFGGLLDRWDGPDFYKDSINAFASGLPYHEANHPSSQGQMMGNGTGGHNQRGYSHGNAYMPSTNSQNTIPEMQVDPSAYPHHSSAQGQMMVAGYWTSGQSPSLLDAQYHQGYSLPNGHGKTFAAEEEHQIAYGPLNYGQGQVALGLTSFVTRPCLNHKVSAYPLHTRRSSPCPLMLPVDSLQLMMGRLSINDEFAMMVMMMMIMGISSQAIRQSPPKEIVLVEPEPSVKQKSHAFCGDNNGVTESYDHFVVVDLKATCDKGVNINPQEIIEFSSILVNAVTGQPASTFHTYVCPIIHPELTEFCKEYNGILQTDVEAGVMLSEALQMHQAWLKEAETKNGGRLSFAIVTWGDSDCRTMLMQECSFKHVTIPYYFYQWINLKKPFAEKFGDNYLLAPVLEAVQEAGLKWKGCTKGGKSHAINKARLLELLIRHSGKLYITGNLLAM